MSHTDYLERLVKEQEKKFADEAAQYEHADKELKTIFDTAIQESNIPKVKEAYQRALAIQSDIKSLEREILRQVDGRHMFTDVRNLLQKYGSSVAEIVQYIEDTTNEHGICLSTRNDDVPYCRSRRTP